MRQTKEDTGSRDWKVRVVKTDWKEVSWVVGRKAFWMASCRSRPAAQREPHVGTDIQGNRGAMIRWRGTLEMEIGAIVIGVNVRTQ